MPYIDQRPQLILEPGIEAESRNPILQFDAALRTAPIEAARILDYFDSVPAIRAALANPNIRDQLPSGAHIGHARRVLAHTAFTLGGYLDVTHFRYHHPTIEIGAGSKQDDWQLHRLRTYVGALAAATGQLEAV